MLQLRAWKIALVVFLGVFGVVFTLPNLLPAKVAASLPAAFGQRLNLGLDLQGGSYLLYEVDTDALRTEQLGEAVESARTALQGAGAGFSGLGVVNGAVQARITDPAKLDAAQTALAKLAQPLPGASGGKDYTVVRLPDQTLQLRAAPELAAVSASKAVDQTIETIRRRIDQLGTREPTIIRQGTNRIVVEAPGESDPERLKSVIGKTAKLSFQLLDDTPIQQALASGLVPPGSQILPSDDGYPGDAQGVLVKSHAFVTGDMLTDSRMAFDSQTGSPAVSMKFNGRGGERFGQITGDNIGKRFAIVLDGRVISAPTIQGRISDQGQITGNFTQESATDLALLLRSGALPAPLKVQEQRAVGAELGADAVRAGAISLGLGAVAIFVFIILAYGLFGVFAAIALLVNVLCLIATLSITQATLTLPGVAGLILTLAVAVDANVLIYERMKDEERAGRTPILAADSGFRRALVSIVDANVTTLIAAAIMFQFGSGPVRGFAWTLSVGVITSLVTAIFITQVLIGWWFRAAKPKRLPI